MHQIVATLRFVLTRHRVLGMGRVLLLGVAAALFDRQLIPLEALLAAVALGAYPLAKSGIVSLWRERKVGTELFVVVATTIAMAGREYTAGAILLAIILIAESIAELTTERARASIQALIGSVPKVAIRREAGGERSVPITELRPGDTVIVKAGERIPVDGTVTRGEAAVDESPITGESVPQEKQPGATVFAGTVVGLGALDVETRKVGGDTLFGRIVKLVETAEEERAPVQKLADRVAAWLIPIVLVFLVAVYLITRDVRMVVTLLIFTSPAELALATPLVVIAGIARAARAGILIKGGIYLELLAKVDVVAFDKTGTLTLGRPTVTLLHPADAGVDERELLRLAAAVERRSSHPLAQAVLEAARRIGIEVPEPTSFEVVRGRGVRAQVEGRTLIAGNALFLRENGVEVVEPPGMEEETVVYVAREGRFLGTLEIADQVRADAAANVEKLKRAGVHRVVMLSGDRQAVAEKVGRELGIDEVFGGLLPEQKVTLIERFQAQGHCVAMVGDGINDAPALARADVGIAMGVAGTQAAIEAADVALMTDDIGKIVTARVIAARAYRTIRENLIVGVGVVHVLGIIAALLRLIGPVQAAMIHLGPDILVFLNSIKLLRVRLEPRPPN